MSNIRTVKKKFFQIKILIIKTPKRLKMGCLKILIIKLANLLTTIITVVMHRKRLVIQQHFEQDRSF